MAFPKDIMQVMVVYDDGGKKLLMVKNTSTDEYILQYASQYRQPHVPVRVERAQPKQEEPEQPKQEEQQQEEETQEEISLEPVTEVIAGVQLSNDGEIKETEMKDSKETMQKVMIFGQIAESINLSLDNPPPVDTNKDSISAVIEAAQALNSLGRAVMEGHTCMVCGKKVKYMPTNGFCSMECFMQDLTTRVLNIAAGIIKNNNEDKDNPVIDALERIEAIMDYLNIVINLIVDLPDLLRELATLPEVYRNFAMLYINIAFITVRMAINTLLIKKNELMIKLLKRVKMGVVSKEIKAMFQPINAIIDAINIVMTAAETAISALLILLDSMSNPMSLNGIQSNSYAFVGAPRAFMNPMTAATGLCVDIINTVPPARMLKMINPLTLLAGGKSSMLSLDINTLEKTIQTAFPSIESFEYFYEPELFKVRWLLSDQGTLVKQLRELLDSILTIGPQYFPRFCKLTLWNPWFILAILDAWSPVAKCCYGSLIMPLL